MIPAPFQFAIHALEKAKAHPLAVDLRLHPDDVNELRRSKSPLVSWEDPGCLRFCGFRVLPTQGIMPKTALVVRKPCVD